MFYENLIKKLFTVAKCYKSDKIPLGVYILNHQYNIITPNGNRRTLAATFKMELTLMNYAL